MLMAILFTGCTSLKSDRSFNIVELDYPQDLQVVTREQWGWTSLQSAREEHKISAITIHHGGEEFQDDKDPVEYLKTLQTWSQIEQNWIDIPYHYMIDLHGRIYETRPINFPGDTNTEYNPDGHALISVMGNYENRTLSEIQLSSLIALTAFLAGRFDVDVDKIKGHKDYAVTACPGIDIYKYLQDGTIVQGVLAQKQN
jgi:hypothetical protein